MVKVLVVNNYPTRERVVTLERCVGENEGDVTPIDWSEVSAGKFDSFDGVVLSGSPDMMSEERTRVKYGREADAVVNSKVPVLGVCFGHQLVAAAFGAEVVRDGRRVLEMVKTTVLESDPLFEGLPNSLMLLESRHEVVKLVPEGFRRLATSETSEIAAMRHIRRPLYGVQFHPERFTRENPQGKAVVGNFIRMLR